MASKVIDVSFNQKNVDWKKVKAAGIKGAIIRCGFRGSETGIIKEDAQFRNHLAGAKAAGLKLGLYFFTEAINEAEARAEAKYVLKLIKDLNIDVYYPIAIDTEDIAGKKDRADGDKLTKKQRTAVVKAFCEEIKSAGYTPMIYANLSWISSELNTADLPYKMWIAHYAAKCGYSKEYSLWQYTSSGKVDGINGSVDISYCYEDFTKKKEAKTMSVKVQGQITKHFSINEYAVSNPDSVVTITPDSLKFMRLTKKLRTKYGKIMHVTSAFRTAKVNKEVGGISSSNHLKGTAMDFYLNIKCTKTVAQTIEKLWKEICEDAGEVGEAGWYPGWNPRGGMHLGIQSAAQKKANGGKFINWKCETNGKLTYNYFKL